MTPQPPQWLIEEAMQKYPHTENALVAITYAKRNAHISAVLGVLERVAEKSWWAGFNACVELVDFGIDEKAAKQQFIDKLKTEGV
jgi:hypothetical protein